MPLKFVSLKSARGAKWTGPISKTDGLPLRDSGGWIEEKHKRLAYFATIFATGMKNSWGSRVYLELFAGPGKCWLEKEEREELGSPLRIIDNEFTKFIFVEIDTSAARALERRLSSHPNADHVEIWNGDCAEAIEILQIPRGSLTLAFIDPTGISGAPFNLIRDLREKARCDLLINVQHGMGIKMNMHQYLPDADIDCALTKFLGDESWKEHVGRPAKAFFSEFLALYRKKLLSLGFKHSDKQVIIKTDRKLPLYLLLFASGHPRGQEFWDKSLAGSDDQAQLELGT